VEEIGRRLRAAREAKGIDLHVVEEDTKIRRKYIEALEAGREADLPGDAYLKGFLRTYGNYVGLDGTALVEEYKTHKFGRPAALEESTPADAPRSRQLETAAAEARVAEARQPEVRRPEPAPARTRPVAQGRRPVRKKGSNRAYGYLVFVVVLVGSVAYLGWRIFGQPAPAPEPTPPTPAPVVDTKVPEPVPTPPPKLPDPPPVTMTRGTGKDVVFTVPAKEVTVRIEPVSNLWLQATVDGKDAGMSTNAEPREFKGNQILINVGHMDRVSLVVNGQRFDKPLDQKSYNLIFEGQK
jgi:cytoskeleton protein RodZ